MNTYCAIETQNTALAYCSHVGPGTLVIGLKDQVRCYNFEWTHNRVFCALAFIPYCVAYGVSESSYFYLAH